MLKTTTQFLVIIAMLFAAPAASTGQVTPVAVEIPAAGVTQDLLLKDGTRLIGRVESIGDAGFTFRTLSGLEMKLNTASVQSLRVFTGRIVKGEVWESDPNTTRLFFGPTGRSLKRGEAYFGVYEVFMPFVQVGVTDRISIGGGTPLVFGDIERPFWITPKVQLFSNARTSASVGVIQFFNFDNAGIAYGVVTHGGEDGAVTIGGGYAYAREERYAGEPYPPDPYRDETDAHGSPVLMIGAERRMSKRTKFVTENYFFQRGGITSLGVRFFGEKLSADFAMMIPLNTEDFYAFPMINIVRKF